VKGPHEKSKRPDGRVLEHNLGLLLRHAYVPVLPKPAFRSELERAWMQTFRRRVLAQGVTRRPGPRRLVVVAAAAAALALALLGWWRVAETPDSPTTPGALLAAGEVALSTDRTTWRAASPTERTAGVRLERATLAVHVPGDATLAVLAADGRIELGGATSARLAPEPALVATLEAGSLTLERSQAGVLPWSLAAGPGAVRLAHGILEADREGELARFTLVAGEARFEGAGETPARALVTGRTLTVVAGAPVEPTVAARVDSIEIPDEREAVAPDEAPEPAQPASPLALAGRVVGPDGEPVAAYRLGLLRERVGNEFQSVSTFDIEDAEGAFRLENVEPGSYTLFAHAAGLPIARVEPLELASGPLTLEEPVRLAPGGSVQGFAFDPATGDPVQDAVVLVERDAPQNILLLNDVQRMWVPISTRTASDGSFRIDHVTPGTHTLRVTARGYGPAWSQPFRVAVGETTPGIEIPLAPGGAVEGRVLQPDGTAAVGKPLICALLDQSTHAQMHFAQALTDPEGRYRFEDLPPESMLVVQVDFDDLAHPRVKPVEIRAGLVQTIDFEAEGALTRVRGVLRDSEGSPVVHRNLAIFHEDALASHSNIETFEATSTLADGSFAFEQIAPGRYHVFAVERTGTWIRLIDSFDVPALSEFEHDLALGTGRVIGRAISSLDGAPVGRAHLILERIQDDGTHTFAGNLAVDADGGFRIEQLAAGEYVVTLYPEVEDLGFERSQPFRLTEHEPEYVFEPALTMGGTLDVEIVDQDGAPVRYAIVYFVDEAGQAHSFSRFPESDEDGRLRAIGARPGTYRAVASKGEHISEPVLVTCRAGAVARARIVLRSDEPAPRERD